MKTLTLVTEIVVRTVKMNLSEYTTMRDLALKNDQIFLYELVDGNITFTAGDVFLTKAGF